MKQKTRQKHEERREGKKSAQEGREIDALEAEIQAGAPAPGTNPLASSADGGEGGSWSSARSFDALPLSQYTKDGLKAAKFKSLTAIQRAVLPHALAGHDVLGCAKTGSGKTLAFIIPVRGRRQRVACRRLLLPHPTPWLVCMHARTHELILASYSMRKGAASMRRQGAAARTHAHAHTRTHACTRPCTTPDTHGWRPKTHQHLTTPHVQLVEKLYRLRWTKFDGLGGLVLTPTRELAMQIFEELRKVRAPIEHCAQCCSLCMPAAPPLP